MSIEKKVKLLSFWPVCHILLFVLISFGIGATGWFDDGIKKPIYEVKEERGRYYVRTSKSKQIWEEIERWQYERRLEGDRINMIFITIGVGSLLIYRHFATAWVRRNAPEFLHKEKTSD